MAQEIPMYGRVFPMPASDTKSHCCCCRQLIEPGSKVHRNQNNGRYKHVGCQPKNGKKNLILSEDELRQSIHDGVSVPRNGRVIRGTRSLS